MTASLEDIGRLIDQGLSRSQIAAQLELTPGQVGGRAWRRGWSTSRPRRGDEQPRRVKPPAPPRVALYPKTLAVRMDAEMYAALQARAAQEKVSMTALVRDFVEWGLET